MRRYHEALPLEPVLAARSMTASSSLRGSNKILRSSTVPIDHMSLALGPIDLASTGLVPKQQVRTLSATAKMVTEAASVGKVDPGQIVVAS